MENSEYLIKCTELLDGRSTIKYGFDKVTAHNPRTAVEHFVNSYFVGKKVDPVIEQVKESKTITTCRVMYYSKNDKLAEENIEKPKPFLVYLINCRNEAYVCQE